MEKKRKKCKMKLHTIKAQLEKKYIYEQLN